MPTHKKKSFYAVVRGAVSPAIFTSWAVACALTSGFPNNRLKGFQMLEEAVSYMAREGFPDCEIIGELPVDYHGPGRSRYRGGSVSVGEGGSVSYYAVANGREVGIYESYYGGSQPEVSDQPHSCHKRFRSREEAEKFIEDFRETAAYVKRHSVQEDVLSEMMGRIRMAG